MSNIEESLLISKDDFFSVKRISESNLQSFDLEPAIRTAQRLRIAPRIGAGLYTDLCNFAGVGFADPLNPTQKESALNTLLFGDLTPIENHCEKLINWGVKNALIEFSFYYMLLNNGSELTPAGLNDYTQEYSQRSSDAQIKRLLNNSLDQAESYMKGVLLFCEINSEILGYEIKPTLQNQQGALKIYLSEGKDFFPKFGY